MSKAIDMEMEAGGLPEVQGREISEEGPIEAPKAKTKRPAKAPVTEDGAPVTELMKPTLKEMVNETPEIEPPMIRPTDKAADGMGFQERIAYEKKVRDANRRASRMPIIIEDVPATNE